MLETLAHLLIPRYSNNHRPRLLHPVTLVILVAAILIFHSTIELIKASSPDGFVLGYASNISVSQVLTQINARRAEFGLSPLTINQQLSLAAANKARHMFEHDYWDHIAPDGTTPWRFIKEQEYKYTIAGENLARDFDTTSPMVQAWMDSPTHRANIIHEKYQETGIAVANGKLGGIETTLVVQIFGAPSSPLSATPVDRPPPAISNDALSDANPDLTSRPASTLALAPKVKAGNQALISPLNLKQAIGLSVILLIIGVLVLDEFLIRKSGTIRFVGRNFAHLSFLAAVIIIITALRPGGVL